MSVQPLQVLDKCIGERVWIIMNNNKEFVGRLNGFDEYMRKKSQFLYIFFIFLLKNFDFHYCYY